MDDQFPLPLECLRIILNHFAINKSTRALTRLLRANKYLADYPRLQRLIRTLLTSVRGDQYSGLVKAMYCPEPSPPQHWPIDYLSHLQHFQSQKATSWPLLLVLFRGLPLPPALKQYLDEHGLVADALAHLDLDIHRELTWILCSRVLAQLRSVVIPLSDTARYLDAAPQMSSLQSVTSRMDTMADTDEWWRPEDHSSADALATLALVKAQRREDLESAVADGSVTGEHPERLAMPSLRTLELNGCWVIADNALEVMLGRCLATSRRWICLAVRALGRRAG
ncbi:hypothetical protein BG000_000500 [Podila horticola]|nr:hypothetical protein BG000_000500 [Podila horticola]